MITVGFNAAVTVTGAPILNMNDGGNALYDGTGGSSSLTLSYTVGMDE